MRGSGPVRLVGLFGALVAAARRRDLTYCFGVSLGDIRVLARVSWMVHRWRCRSGSHGTSTPSSWPFSRSQPKKLSADEMERMVPARCLRARGGLVIAYVVRQHPDKETFGQRMDGHGTTARQPVLDGTPPPIGVAPRVRTGSLSLLALLDRIEFEMARAVPEVQWTMNSTLAQSESTSPNIASGPSPSVKLGIYRDYPVSKGCTSPFAPIWINFMVSWKPVRTPPS